MIDIAILEKFVELISINDIKNLFNIEDDTISEIYGSYKAFKKGQLEEDEFIHDILNFIRLCSEEDKKYYDWIIVVKKGNAKYLFDCITYFFRYFWKKTDLNLLTRIQLSLLKTKNWVGKIKYAVDIYEYDKYKEYHDKQIHKLFKYQEVSRIYIYRATNNDLLREANFEIKYKI